MPWPIPILISLQGEIKRVKDMAGQWMKRGYKDKERSPELIQLADQIVEEEALCKAVFKALVEIHESDEGYRRFRDMLLKGDESKDEDASEES